MSAAMLVAASCMTEQPTRQRPIRIERIGFISFRTFKLELSQAAKSGFGLNLLQLIGSEMRPGVQRTTLTLDQRQPVGFNLPSDSSCSSSNSLDPTSVGWSSSSDGLP